MTLPVPWDPCMIITSPLHYLHFLIDLQLQVKADYKPELFLHLLPTDNELADMPTCFKDNSLLLGLKANLFLKIQEIKKNQSQLFLYFAFFVWLDVSFQVAILGYLSQQSKFRLSERANYQHSNPTPLFLSERKREREMGRAAVAKQARKWMMRRAVRARKTLFSDRYMAVA